MTQLERGQSSRLLGYPAGARLLLVNADDFGMCHSNNEAILRALRRGVVRSTSVMAPCPWARHAMQMLLEGAAAPTAPSLGVHLTLVCETVHYRWGPLSPRADVPSLVDEAGDFYAYERREEMLAGAVLEEVEVEFRTQIEAVAGAGLRPTHLDWHCLNNGGREDICELTLRLAQEYGLAMRIAGEPWAGRLQGRGLPTNDHELLDSFRLDPPTKAAQYVRLLRELPAGLTEWAVHPGLDTGELLALEPAGNHVRQTDYDFFVSEQARAVVEEEGIVLVDYRALQAVWQGA